MENYKKIKDVSQQQKQTNKINHRIINIYYPDFS